jgi:hypothetical protein
MQQRRPPLHHVALQIDDAGPLMEHALLKPFLRRLPDLAR